MLTEQDVLKHINDAINNKKELSETTKKYLNKFNDLEARQNAQQEKLANLRTEAEKVELSVIKTAGAISLIIEMVAEEEGLLSDKNTPTEGD